MSDVVDLSGFTPIPQHEKYLISQNGDIYSLKTNKFLKPSYNHKKYKMVNIEGKSSQVHRLVALTYIENPNNYPQVNHIDENKDNNNVSNLEWCTNAYNSRYGTRGRRISYALIHSKVAPKRKCVCIDKKNNRVIVFPTILSTECYGFTEENVRKVCKGKRKTHKGCKFMYYEDWIRGDTNELPRNKNR